ncbi:sigma-54-dependent Fis family transcriptional regulator [Burkholderia cenocepacia]|uniref:sigma-54 dependent transcriptional regulator n=1 Tax=Burkholderia cenocepacia TaxID=95486 RepID=UPI0009B58707|nr:sigma-54 dependent transcriptional regulator [Burkholderia cenocepacia]ELW9530033.1 sigma-54-dependent Fis family transcriptional regulator [Burkholderia cenocepacia]MDN7628077.1 sigma 54-interacting transcriptional regulator [Burkholderia cenocepacia]RQT97013.1 sigma-54-dependent Fis family transcriptional regulator [Burkholderia cenocepacia]RQU28676.1 sigma-54-dependent Fis family transcriptional regulator [Burkholderia cenocepacia]RQU53338.1 sigma-54-dependent Fis family transcriptional 
MASLVVWMPRKHDHKYRSIGGVMKNIKKRRGVVYFSKNEDSLLVEELSRRNWRVSPMPELGEFVASDNSTKGGILDLRDTEVDDLKRINNACAKLRNVRWVALIEKNFDLQGLALKIVLDHCFDYISLPMHAGRIVDAVGHAYGMEELATRKPVSIPHLNNGMIGSSDVMLKLFKMVKRIACSEAPVHIFGETGTGKELTASAIHQCSPRRTGPFVALNCGAIPSHLLQSELFGYERGAFTGATGQKKGLIETANGGTLLLDEIGDLPLESQVSLLRVLQEGRIFRLGSTHSISVDVRIVTATHVDLEKACREGRFRPDLYHRLCVLRIDQPPLRSRGNDLEVLAYHALQMYKSDADRPICGFSEDAVAALYSYEWPGNIRELFNRIRRAIVMTSNRFITAEDLELDSNWYRGKRVDT